MADDELMVMRARLATTRTLEAYGGVKLTADVLDSMARSLVGGDIPMLRGHDHSNPLTATVLDAGVEDLEDNEKALWVEFRIPRSEWDAIQAWFDSEGVSGGMSIGVGEPLGDQRPDEIFSIAADAYHFADEEIVAAAQTGSSAGHVNASRLYQFSVLPELAIVVHFALSVLQQVPVDLLSASIGDALRSLWNKRKSKRASITIRAERTSSSAVTVVSINTNSADEFESAIKGLPEVISNLAELQEGQAPLIALTESSESDQS